MNNRTIIRDLIQLSIDEMNDTIDCLYTTSNSCTKNRLLNRLRKHLTNIQELMKDLGSTAVQSLPEERRVFTLAELSAYNGKNGSPAYVAVNGMVYDVTDTAAWGGATHFGLTAGRDVTKEFAACHEGQQILRNLTMVGMMRDGTGG